MNNPEELSNPTEEVEAGTVTADDAATESSTPTDDLKPTQSWFARNRKTSACGFLAVLGLVLGLYFGLRDPNTDFELAGRPIRDKDKTNGFGNQIAISDDGNLLVATAAGKSRALYAFQWTGYHRP